MILKTVYISICSLLLFFLVACLIQSIRKHTKLFKVIANIQVLAILTIVFILYAINIPNARIAQIFYSLSFSILALAIIIILRLVMILENEPPEHKAERIGRYVFYILLSIDVCFMLIRPDLYFDLTPIYLSEKFYSWEIHYKRMYLIHQFVVYSFSLKILVKLIDDCVKNHKFYRKKFTVFLILFVIEQVSNIVCNLYICHLKFDFTPIICGGISIYAFYFAAVTVPKTVKNNMLSIASDTISDAVICFDNKGKCLYVNKSGRKIYTPNESTWVNKYLNSSDDYINCEDSFDINGEIHTYKIEYKKIRDEGNKYSGAYIKLADITLELREISQEEYRATHDELTGLANRPAFFAQCEQIIRQNPEVPRYLVATNIKNFKVINDLFGTKFGDNLIKRQADMLNRANYTNCVKGRLSSDKFAMLISKKNFNPELAVKNTDLVRELGQEVSFPITMQLGVYEIADTTEKVYTMYNKALLAIKNNKDVANQKCTLAFYDTSLTDKILYEQNIIGEFKHALKDNKFHIFIQAQVNSQDESCKGGEALVRWYDPNSLYRQPGEFIEILEKSGLIYKLDYYVWEKSAELLSKWKKAGYEDFYISVNISAKDFYYADLYQVFTGLVEKYDISPSNYNLELTESAVIDKKFPHKKVIQQLREYGFNIEMDDFGSGYSSLNVLKEIEMDVLKIDMEFLNTSENEERGKSIIAAIVKMAKSLGMRIVAEGVETEDQKNYLREIGVDVFQGYLFSRPIDVEQFEKKYMGGAL